MTSSNCSIRASRSFAFALALSSALVVGRASAQADAVAENLFRDGKKLLEAKNYDEACPKFAESARIAPSSGVELALGICYEEAGKTASAWGAYSAVIGLARRDARKDREAAAATHLAALEARLARVTFVVPTESAALPGFELRQDDVVLGSAAWTGTPIDPGVHKLDVRAPGYTPYSTTFTVGAEAGVRSVNVPALVPLPVVPVVVSPVVPPTPELSPTTASPASPVRQAGYVVGGAGVVGLVVGGVLGGVALAKVGDVHSSCPGGRCTSASAVSENGTAGTLADASTGTFIGGGALVAAGALMVLLAPRSAEPTTPRAALRPVIGPGYAGLRGDF